jgi:hypothetical protein
MLPIVRRHRLIAGGTGAVLLVVVLAWIFWPEPQAPPPPRQREYRAQTACLLTDDKGLWADPAKSAWAGMQDASTAKLIKVQYLSVSGPQTSANALSYFNSLALQKCTLIVAVGDVPVAAMVEGSGRFTDIRYIAVGGDTKGASISKIELTSNSVVRSTVNAAVADVA